MNAQSPADCFDTIIVGASPAGLSTALILGRSLRRVLIIDSGRLNLLSYWLS